MPHLAQKLPSGNLGAPKIKKRVYFLITRRLKLPSEARVTMTVVAIVTTSNRVDHRQPPRQIGFLCPDSHQLLVTGLVIYFNVSWRFLG
jgi:hypothetical protein